VTQLVIEKNKSLSSVCTLGIGGPAKLYTVVSNIEKMQQALSFCKQNNLPYFILGKGSNILFDDLGFNGMVIQNKIDFIKELHPGIFHVGAGYSFSLLGIQTTRKEWSGMEFAAGIPGTVGGAIFMNAGANGSEISQTLVSVDFLNSNGELQILNKHELHFDYRFSSFQKKRGAIVGGTFKLLTSKNARINQLKLIDYRTKTQPYSDKSAGCIFLNPKEKSAGALIDTCGLKGTQIGGAKISEQHANFIINVGNSSSQDVLKLINLAQIKVKESTGIELECEVRYIPHEAIKYD
jgi:UDP-N-acetylmuramate dehydrogenase